MDYRPNVDGAIWFAKQVAPLIFVKLPSAHVYFVGAHPPAALRRLQDARITVTGAVDDIRPYIQSACAVVAPLLIARGVQNKVLEAMAMTKPVVATAQATRALDVRAGVDLWIENEPARFADAVVTAIESPLRHEVMQNARTYVEQHHDWQQIFVGLDQLLERLAQSTSARDRLTERLRGVTARRFESDVSGAQA